MIVIVESYCRFVPHIHTYIHTYMHAYLPIQTERAEQFEQRARLLECEVRAQQITAGIQGRENVCMHVCMYVYVTIRTVYNLKDVRI